jgi:hypothetical protein
LPDDRTRSVKVTIHYVPDVPNATGEGSERWQTLVELVDRVQGDGLILLEEEPEGESPLEWSIGSSSRKVGG